MEEFDDSFEYSEDFDDEIWDEGRWEKFMQEADRQADEYLKKMEEELERAEEFSHNFDSSEKEQEVEKDDEVNESEFSECENEIWKPPDVKWKETERKRDFEQIPAYSTAYDFGFAVNNFIKKFYPERFDIPEIRQLAENCFVIAVKIAGGHGMGYERDVLEGNIANCKRGLKAAENCLDALENFRIKTKATPELLNLYGFSQKTRNAVREWIEELRNRIWWR